MPISRNVRFMLTVHSYQKCSTCRNAVAWLRKKGIPFDERSIRETPPDEAELAAMLEAKANSVRALFNTSGQDYRALELKDKLPQMFRAEAFALLRSNGMLVKRPFAADPKRGIFLLGFKEEEWEKAFA